MSLPIINSSKYELKLPSNKQTINFRPFLVKEEKILLVANETGKQTDMIDAMIDILKACTYETVNPSTMPLIDFEYLFLHIRGKSVGEILKLKVKCPDDNETFVDVDINVNDVKIPDIKKLESIISITDKIKIELREPSIMDFKHISENVNANYMINLIGNCIVRVYDGEKVYEDFTKEDRTRFLDSLTTGQFQKLTEFYDASPKLKHDIKVKNPKTNIESEVSLEGLNNFF